MWLRYGVDSNKALVCVDDVPSGKSDLTCPYCGGLLTAKKGHRLGHHFAHTNETCREVNRDNRSIPYLPLYDSFNIWLTGKELQKLKDLWNRYGIKDIGIDESLVPKILIKEKLLEKNTYRHGKYQFTKLGKIPVGALSLMLFNQVQEPMLLEKLQQLEKNAQTAYLENSPLFNQHLRDLQIYRAEFRKILLHTLYYLQIDTGEITIYKIGVTQRNLSERLAEIERDLRSHFQSFSVKVLGEWWHRGNVEKYFKHRYSFFNFSIGDLTEYYNFFTPEQAKAVLRDLRRMEPKGLSKIEAGILAGEPSQTENLMAERELADRRSKAIKTGMERAKNWGQHVGRPPVSESALEFLAKPSSQKVIEALEQGLSLRKAAEQAGVAVNTVRKVQRYIKSKY